MFTKRIFIYICLFCAAWSLPANAQKEADAVQAAMAVVINKYSTQADTVAKELSARFNKDVAIQTALARAYFRNNEREKTRLYLDKAFAISDKYVPS